MADRVADVEVAGSHSASLTHRTAKLRVGEQPLHRCGERSRVPVRDLEPFNAIGHDLGEAADVADHSGLPERHGLDQRDRQTLVFRREDEHIER